MLKSSKLVAVKIIIWFAVHLVNIESKANLQTKVKNVSSFVFQDLSYIDSLTHFKHKLVTYIVHFYCSMVLMVAKNFRNLENIGIFAFVHSIGVCHWVSTSFACQSPPSPNRPSSFT